MKASRIPGAGAEWFAVPENLMEVVFCVVESEWQKVEQLNTSALPTEAPYDDDETFDDEDEILDGNDKTYRANNSVQYQEDNAEFQRLKMIRLEVAAKYTDPEYAAQKMRQRRLAAQNYRIRMQAEVATPSSIGTENTMTSKVNTICDTQKNPGKYKANNGRLLMEFLLRATKHAAVLLIS